MLRSTFPAYALAQLVLHLDMVGVMPGNVVVDVGIRPSVAIAIDMLCSVGRVSILCLPSCSLVCTHAAS